MAKATTKAAASIRFSATLYKPAGGAKNVSWVFLRLPKRASGRLPSRGMVTVEGVINGAPLLATLEPDGQGGHWLKVGRKLREAAGAAAGDIVTLRVAPVPPEREPEPKVPADLGAALAEAPAKAREVWSAITPVARRDWIYWIVSAKQAQTRARRIENACSMLVAGKRRACCFDRSGMYSKGLGCPVGEGEGMVTTGGAGACTVHAGCAISFAAAVLWETRSLYCESRIVYMHCSWKTRRLCSKYTLRHDPV